MGEGGWSARAGVKKREGEIENLGEKKEGMGSLSPFSISTETETETERAKPPSPPSPQTRLPNEALPLHPLEARQRREARSSIATLSQKHISIAGVFGLLEDFKHLIINGASFAMIVFGLLLVAIPSHMPKTMLHPGYLF